jgi:cystathionine gamma-synthase
LAFAVRRGKLRRVMNERKRHPETLTAHAGHDPFAAGGAVVPPLQPSTTFVRDDDNRPVGPDIYQRPDSPTLRPAEAVLARLEGGAECMLFASGMAAAAAVVQALRPGDHMIAQRTMYWSLRNWLVAFCRD